MPSQTEQILASIISTGKYAAGQEFSVSLQTPVVTMERSKRSLRNKVRVINDSGLGNKPNRLLKIGKILMPKSGEDW